MPCVPAEEESEMTQTDAILAALKSGPLTPLDALERFGCFRMAARVRDLRDRGHHIHTEIVEQGGKRFARYSLVGGRG